MASTSAARSRVLSAYRRLNRARVNLFRGDDHAMTVSREQMRTEFIKNRYVSPSGPEWEAMVAGIDEAADMLNHEILRGDLNKETGRYGTFAVQSAVLFILMCPAPPRSSLVLIRDSNSCDIVAFAYFSFVCFQYIVHIHRGEGKT